MRGWSSRASTPRAGGCSPTAGRASRGTQALIAKVFDPLFSGARVAVTTYATDQGAQEHFAATSSLEPGSNTIAWRIPKQDGVAGIQFKDDAAWGGRLYLGEVAW